MGPAHWRRNSGVFIQSINREKSFLSKGFSSIWIIRVTEDAGIEASLTELEETGPLECWSTGVLECWEKNLKSIPDHYSILPPFHYSICKRMTSVNSSEALHRPAFRGIQGVAGERSS